MEPVHFHISKGKPRPNSTKIWITKSGGYIVANNNSRIPKNELNEILETISPYYFKIVDKWKEIYGAKNLKFYC